MTEPFLKWAGNKRLLVERIKTVLPRGKRLIEPFAGSCAVGLGTEYPAYLMGDANKHLINLYLHLQTTGQEFIDYARFYFDHSCNMPDIYYALRMAYPDVEPLQQAAGFLYFNKHGYNGLCRFNRKGGFNVPFGRYDNPCFPEENMKAFYAWSKKVSFVCADFEDVMNQAEFGDVVYCDPPYVPLSPTASFTNYSAGGFGEKDQVRLAELVVKLSERGVPVVISNHDTPFTRQLYSGAKELHFFEVQRNISCNGAKRGKAPELMAVFE